MIDYRAEGVKAVLKREYPRGVDVVWESVGGDMFSVVLDALAPRGRLVIIGMMWVRAGLGRVMGNLDECPAVRRIYICTLHGTVSTEDVCDPGVGKWDVAEVRQVVKAMCQTVCGLSRTGQGAIGGGQACDTGWLQEQVSRSSRGRWGLGVVRVWSAYPPQIRTSSRSPRSSYRGENGQWVPGTYPGLAEKLLWKSASAVGFFLLK